MHSKFKRIGAALEYFGNPEKGMKFVHVTGSNGKGSVCAMIASILKETGLKVGLFTSPHVHKWNERIKVSGIDISDEDLESLGNQADKACAELEVVLSEMERFFVIALVYFGEVGIDIGVIEVGIGGRLDATNIIDGTTSIITNIELEHSHILGDTVEEIAYDKAGIIKEGAVCITTETDEKLIGIFAKEAREKRAKLVVLEDSDVDLISQSIKGQVFDFMEYRNLELPLLGDHQLKNASLAIMSIDVLKDFGFQIDEFLIKQGLKNVKWPLRLEVVKNDGPTVLIDGAHTVKAIKSTLKTINQFWGDKRRIAVVGFSEGKKYEEMLDLLINQVDVFVLTKAEYRGLEVERLSEYLDGEAGEIFVTGNVEGAIEKALEIAGKDDLIMVLGGLYLGAEARQAFLPLHHC